MPKQYNKTAICYTCAYNAEKTISRTIDSVLNQTYTDFKYYIYDNGSADKTREIIYHYASLDNRIIPLHGDINHLHLDGTGYSPAWEFTSDTVVKEYDDGNAEYVFYLDADDEYLPGFLEEMIAFLEDNNLDLACCGSDFITAETGELRTKRLLPENLILEEEGFGAHLIDYHEFTRTVWAKLFKISLIKRCDFGNYKPLFDAAGNDDCLFCLRAYLLSDRVGILAKSLHIYYEAASSTSGVYFRKRASSIPIAYDEEMKFLHAKKGAYNPINTELVINAHFSWFTTSVIVLVKSDMSDTDKLLEVKQLLSYPQLQEMLKHNYTRLKCVYDLNDKKNDFLRLLSDWVLSCEAVRSGECSDIAADILSAIDTVHSNSGFEEWADSEIIEILVKTRQKSESEALNKELDDIIAAVASRHNLLAGYTADFIVFFADISKAVLDGNLGSALESIIDIIENEQEIPDNAGIPIVELGLNISAACEHTQYFVFLKKVHISLLIDKMQHDRAKTELDEWLELIPDDEDFIKLSLTRRFYENAIS